MKRRASILRAALGWLSCLLLTASAFAHPVVHRHGRDAGSTSPVATPTARANTPAAAPVPAPVARADTPAPAPAAAPLTHSSLDSEPIRRGTSDSGNGGAGSSRSQGLELSRVGFAPAIVIGLIFAIRWLGRKLFHQAGAGRSSRAVQVLARAPLAPRQHIVLVRVGRRVIVVGDCGTQMNPLCEITDGDEIAALLGQLQDDKMNFQTRAFSALFQRAKRDMGGEEDDPAASASSADMDTGAPENADPQSSETPDDPAISDTRSEISGLMAKIRVMSSQIRKGHT